MFYQLILHHLFQVGSFSAQMRQSVNNVLNQVEPVKFVLYSDVECRSDSAFFNVTPDMYIPVGAAVGQTMNQPWISMKTKNYMFVYRKERIEIRFIKTVWVLAGRLKLHQIDDIDHPDFQIG